MSVLSYETLPCHGEGVPATERWTGIAAAAALLAALTFAPLVVGQATLNDLGQAVALGMFSISFNVLFRYGGLLSFGHAAFFGSAAYGFALLFAAFPSVAVPVLVLAAGVLTGIAGLIVGHVCVKRSGAYFSMSTLAFAALVSAVAAHWEAVTGGTDGLGGFVPAVVALLPGWHVSAPSIGTFYGVTLAILLPVTVGTWAILEATPFGRAVVLTMQNETRAASFGYDTHRIKRATFALAAGVAGVAGALWALQNGFVSTDSIDIGLSTNVIIMAVIGGTRWFWGPMLGSIGYVFGSDRLSEVTTHWPLWIGLVFIAMVLLCPTGLSGLAAACVRLAQRHRRG